MHINASVAKFIVALCYYLLTLAYMQMVYESDNEANRELNSHLTLYHRVLDAAKTRETCGGKAALNVLYSIPLFPHFVRVQFPRVMQLAKRKKKLVERNEGQDLVNSLVDWGNAFQDSVSLNHLWSKTHSALVKLNTAQKKARISSDKDRWMSKCQKYLKGTTIPVDIVETLKISAWRTWIEGDDEYDIPGKSHWDIYIGRGKGMRAPFYIMHIQILNQALHYVAYDGDNTKFQKEFPFIYIPFMYTPGETFYVDTFKRVLETNPNVPAIIFGRSWMVKNHGTEGGVQTIAEFTRATELDTTPFRLTAFELGFDNAEGTGHDTAVTKNVKRKGWTMHDNCVNSYIGDTAITGDQAKEAVEEMMKRDTAFSVTAVQIDVIIIHNTRRHS